MFACRIVFKKEGRNTIQQTLDEKVGYWISRKVFFFFVGFIYGVHPHLCRLPVVPVSLTFPSI
jgi:hypothetical protein